MIIEKTSVDTGCLHESNRVFVERNEIAKSLTVGNPHRLMTESYMCESFVWSSRHRNEDVFEKSSITSLFAISFSKMIKSESRNAFLHSLKK